MRTLLHFYQNKPEWLNEFYTQIEIIIKHHKLKINMIFLAFLTIFLFNTIYKSNNINHFLSVENKHNQNILNQLNEISLVLQNLQNNQLNVNKPPVLQTIEEDIVQLKNSETNHAKINDIQKISNQIISIKDEISSQMNDFKKTVSQSVNKEFLDINALPFHIVSIDVLAGQSYVSVEYDHHLSPLALGDFLAGWRLVNANYDLGIAEFMNDSHQYIKVSLQGP